MHILIDKTLFTPDNWWQNFKRTEILECHFKISVLFYNLWAPQQLSFVKKMSKEFQQNNWITKKQQQQHQQPLKFQQIK